nr:hypothetical protein [uncultured Desulfobacter sp.]
MDKDSIKYIKKHILETGQSVRERRLRRQAMRSELRKHKHPPINRIALENLQSYDFGTDHI